MVNTENVLIPGNLDDRGREIPDPSPMIKKTGLRVAETTDERIMRILQGEMSRRAAEHGLETIDEANDFDVQDDFERDELVTKYQLIPDEYPRPPKPKPRPSRAGKHSDLVGQPSEPVVSTLPSTNPPAAAGNHSSAGQPAEPDAPISRTRNG